MAQASKPSEAGEGAVRVEPMDEHNQKLVDHVHPADWENPEPKERYHLVVIGAGPAGLVTAAVAAGLGAKVALVERHLLGGDCLNVGCVPSKALLRAARAAAEVRRAHELGVRVDGEVSVDFGAVMERVRRLRADLSHHDSAERFQGLGCDVFLGSGRFTGPDAVEVAGKTLRFKKAVIATGARAAAPPIPGLDGVGYLTNETLFELTELPERLGVLGGGPIGCEMAQAFARLGAKVTLFDMAEHVLPREDADAARVVQEALGADGVELVLGAELEEFSRDDGVTRVALEQGGEAKSFEVDALLVSAGRKPNVDGLGLEEAGVRYDGREGVEVDDELQTSNPAIFAAGDVASRYHFTHVADFLARAVIRNALFPRLPVKGGSKVSSLVIPWCTYTEPEVAHVGMYEEDARREGIPVKTFVQELAGVDRAVLEGTTEGFVKVHVREGTDEILGATIVAPHAGDMISEVSTAMAAGLGLGKIANVIHPYPTEADAIRKLGDAYNRSNFTDLKKSLLKRYFSLTG